MVKLREAVVVIVVAVLSTAGAVLCRFSHHHYYHRDFVLGLFRCTHQHDSPADPAYESFDTRHHEKPLEGRRSPTSS